MASRFHFLSHSRILQWPMVLESKYQVTQSVRLISSPILGQHTFKYLHVSPVTRHTLNTCLRVSTNAAHFGHTTLFINLLYCRLHKVEM
ncbi:hypothetical protein ERO13_D04G105700v2 [Gossypium hirsutum]|uniref:Uncharacterized protein n=1 Tax=Gossypium tomentosum TaxID=34277 RepID=A0A5D2LD24_GOSTO|nr:hypothetical protein ERO13_D04G105700v2 [Gossypium hirsutum]TYH77139.1 hypothetical protein ES332_D04G132600v1 [Gossypium tomentosum]